MPRRLTPVPDPTGHVQPERARLKIPGLYTFHLRNFPAPRPLESDPSFGQPADRSATVQSLRVAVRQRRPEFRRERSFRPCPASAPTRSADFRQHCTEYVWRRATTRPVFVCDASETAIAPRPCRTRFWRALCSRPRRSVGLRPTAQRKRCDTGKYVQDYRRISNHSKPALAQSCN